MNIQQWEAWKKAAPIYKKNVLAGEKIRYKKLGKLIKKMEANLK